MTHTKSSNFRRIAEGLDVEPLLQLLDAKPELWKEIETRQKFTGSPHKQTETIHVRGALKMSAYYLMWDTGAYDYPCMKYLAPALVPLMRPILEQLQVKEMGRVMIVNLKPCGHVTRHIDEGKYADYYKRFHICLKTNPHCYQTSGDQRQVFNAGEAWLFNHKQPHTADNLGDSERWHIIADYVPTEELQY